jgi:hypothetical protein
MAFIASTASCRDSDRCQTPHLTIAMTTTAASTSQLDSKAPFDDSSPGQASLPQSESQCTAALEPDLVLSPPLDSGTSTLPPLAGPSSPEMPMTDANNNASGGKRKQEDVDDAFQADNSNERKKLKQESLDDVTSSLMAPEHMSDVAGAESPVNVCSVPLEILLLTFTAGT